MSLINLQGFDHLPSGISIPGCNVADVARLTGISASSHMMRPYVTTGYMTLQTRKVGDRTFTGFSVSGSGSASSQAAMYINTSALTTYQPVGKWHFGVRMAVGNLGATGPRYLYLSSSTRGILATTYKVGNYNLVNNAVNYYNITIDWDVGTVTFVVNGDVDNKVVYTFTVGDRITLYLGHHTFIPSGGAAAYVLANGNASSWIAFSDLYFAVDNSDYSDITGYLGPVQVKSLTLDNISGGTKWKSSDATKDVLTTLKDPLLSDLSNQMNPTAVSDPEGEELGLRFTTPVESAAIKGVAVSLSGYRDVTSDADLAYSLTDGAIATAEKTAVLTSDANSLTRVELLTADKALDGGSWTPEKISGLVTKIKSVKKSL